MKHDVDDSHTGDPSLTMGNCQKQTNGQQIRHGHRWSFQPRPHFRCDYSHLGDLRNLGSLITLNETIPPKAGDRFFLYKGVSAL